MKDWTKECPLHGKESGGSLDIERLKEWGNGLYYIWRCVQGSIFVSGMVMGPVPGLEEKYRSFI